MKSYSAHEIHGVKRGLLKWDLAHVMSAVWLSGTWGSSGVPVCQPLVSPLFVKDRYFVEDFRRTISLIQIGAKGEVHPLETG